MAKSAFHALLNEGDEENQTVGCRHTNPDNCRKHSMPAVCAFVRKDNICLDPPASWPRQYQMLKERESGTTEPSAETQPEGAAE
jgi:hypothetical protein